MATMTTVFFYMITSYTPTYGNTVLKLSETSAFAVTMCVGLANFILLPTMGGVSDRFGRKPLLVGASVAAVLTSFPVLLWLIDAPSFPRLLVVELWLAFVYATYNGAMVVFLTEVMPASLRTTGFSFAYSLATAVFGGFTPAISTGLIRFGQDRGYDSAPALPGVWLSAAAAIGLLAVLALTRITRTPAEHHTRRAEIDGIRSGRTL
jgi:MHS family citrate/tricarballylate:H+ symporter-like MFS transporter